MGGVGALLHSQIRPDLFSAAMAFVPPLVLRDAGVVNRLFVFFGSIDQNLRTNIQGQPGIWDLLDQQWRIRQPHLDWPYALIVCGKNDVVAPWSVSAETYTIVDSAKTGYALYWDERGHRDWGGAHYHPSIHLIPEYLTRFRSNQSFPAFSKTDMHPARPGRQPDPGNGDPQDGDPWGTWGGYLEWDTEDIIDTPDRWECSIWITSRSRYDCDIPDSDTAVTSVTLRKLQSFASGWVGCGSNNTYYLWKVIDISSGSILQEGTTHTSEDGSITIDDLIFSKDPYRLIITSQVPANEKINR